MNWEAIGAISEVIGAVAIIVTLIFFAGQFKQSNTLGRAEAERDWFSTWNVLVRESMGSSEAAELMRNGLNSYFNLSPNEQAVFSTRLIGMFDHVDVLRRLHEHKYVADDLIETLLTALNAMVSTPGGLAWWKEVGPMISIYKYFEEQRNEEAIPITQLMPYFSMHSSNNAVDVKD